MKHGELLLGATVSFKDTAGGDVKVVLVTGKAQ